MFSIHKSVLWQDITLRCPADLRILEARGLKVIFSLLVFPLLTSRQKSLNCFLFLESKYKQSLSLAQYNREEFQWGYSLPIWVLSHNWNFCNRTSKLVHVNNNPKKQKQTKSDHNIKCSNRKQSKQYKNPNKFRR